MVLQLCSSEIENMIDVSDVCYKCIAAVTAIMYVQIKKSRKQCTTLKAVQHQQERLAG